MRIPSLIAAALATVLGVASCAEDGTEPADGGAMHITLVDPDLTLVAGASATVRVTVVRNTFVGQLTLRAEGVPSGVLAPDVIVSRDENEGLMVFTATAGANPGVSDISIKAEGDSVTPSLRILHLQIRPPGSFTITCDPISLAPGATASTTLTINRLGGFTGTVTLSLAPPTGISAAVQPGELTGNSSTSLVTILADRTVRPGAYFLRVTASSPGFTDETFDITVTVAGS